MSVLAVKRQCLNVALRGFYAASASEVNINCKIIYLYIYRCKYINEPLLTNIDDALILRGVHVCVCVWHFSVYVCVCAYRWSGSPHIQTG